MVPDDLRYTKEHEWVRVEGDEAVIGITQYAADQLGDIVFVELPTSGKALEQFATFGVVESVKAVSDLYAPVAGEVVGDQRGAGRQARARQRRAVRRRLDGPGAARRPGRRSTACSMPPAYERAGRRGLTRCRTARTPPTIERGCSRAIGVGVGRRPVRGHPGGAAGEPACDLDPPGARARAGRPAPGLAARNRVGPRVASSAPARTATGRRPPSTSCCCAASGTRPTRRTSPRSARARSRASTSTSRCSPS